MYNKIYKNQNIMTQQEFEKRIGTEVSSDTFDYANRVYMAAGEMDKDTFCKDWRDQYVSESKIVSALTVEVEELRSALNASNGCYANATRGIRDFTSQMADFLIIQAEKWSASDLREKAINLVGAKDYLRRKLEMKFDLWEADRIMILEYLGK